MSKTKTNKTKSAELKTRCYPKFKAKIERISEKNLIPVSNFILSAIETYISLQENQVYMSYGNFSNTLSYTIAKNKIYNIISLDPNIPDSTKEKIRKELDKFDFCKLYH